MARTINIGVQDFSGMIENNDFYVDKTDFIKEWWENRDTVTLITRPRRFGKTLTMSMLNYFFSIHHTGRSDLFKDLSIWKYEKYQKLQGTYPVIFLSFASVKGDNFATVREIICQRIAVLYKHYACVSEVLGSNDRNFFNRVSDTMNDAVLFTSLNRLSEFLYEYYDKRVIILVDEYDTPMQEAYLNGYWDEMVNLMRGLFNSTFKTNPYLERGLMTGITRVSKESMFSDLNNLVVVTTSSNLYETSFGFKEQEVAQALDEYGLSDKKQQVKEWYDGFKFGDCDSIYNPWSIINYLKQRKFAAYWANTSSNALIGKLIRKFIKDIRQDLGALLQHESIRVIIDEQIVFNQLDSDLNAFWSLLLAGGYLKVVDFYSLERYQDEDTIEYELVLTNTEVFSVFRKMIRGWFSEIPSDYNYFMKSLAAGDVSGMNSSLSFILQRNVSFFDTGSHVSERTEPEHFYHGLVLGLLVGLSNEYMVTSNRESGFGRCDVMLEPKEKGFDGIILEFKVIDTENEKTLEDTVHSAIQQILDKKYASDLERRCDRNRIRIYGFAFRGKEILIDGGLLSEYEVSGLPPVP